MTFSLFMKNKVSECRNHNWLIIILIVFYTCTNMRIFAQVPGYQGKTRIISYDIYSFPAISNPNYKGNQGPLSFNLLHKFNFDLTTSEKRSLGISLVYLRTRLAFDKNINGEYIITGTSYTDLHIADLTIGDYSTDITTIGIGINFKKFHLKTFTYAPEGWYFKPEIFAYRINTNLNSDHIKEDIYLNLANKYSYSAVLENYPKIPSKINLYTGGINMSFGKQTILLSSLVLDYGIQIGYLYMGYNMSEILSGASNGGCCTTIVFHNLQSHKYLYVIGANSNIISHT
jgi:hypothetical protein